MNVQAMSNTDLLAVLLGNNRDMAARLAQFGLLRLFEFSSKSEYSGAAEERVSYVAHPVLAAAKELYVRALQEELTLGECLSSPEAVKAYLIGRLAHSESEQFWALWLDAQNRLIASELLFTGTLTQTAVYTRELVKSALRHNAASLVIAHNHPSGCSDPSGADIRMTRSLKDALYLVDVRLLDHFIVAGNQAVSFAEKGLI